MSPSNSFFFFLPSHITSVGYGQNKTKSSLFTKNAENKAKTYFRSSSSSSSSTSGAEGSPRIPSKSSSSEDTRLDFLRIPQFHPTPPKPSQLVISTARSPDAGEKPKLLPKPHLSPCLLRKANSTPRIPTEGSKILRASPTLKRAPLASSEDF